MTTYNTHPTKRLGLALRRAAAWAGRFQGKFIKWQVSKGIPFKIAKVLVLLLNLAVAGLLLYLFAWVFASLMVIMALLYIAGNHHTSSTDFDTFNMNNNKDEWRYGHAGYGRYDLHGFRLDQHDPNAPEDDVL